MLWIAISLLAQAFVPSTLAQDKAQELPGWSSVSELGFVRVATLSPKLFLGEPAKNGAEIETQWRAVTAQGAQIVVAPEMALTGYTIGDFVKNHRLLQSVVLELKRLVQVSRELPSALAVGLPYQIPGGGIVNAAAVVYRGEILGMVPKSYLPNYNEFQDMRWYRSWLGEPNQQIQDPVLGSFELGTRQIFGFGDVRVGIEICEDGWAPAPPSAEHALAGGAEVILNLSASNGLIGKASKRLQLIREHGERRVVSYVYSSSGPRESTTGLVFDGHMVISELGTVLSESRAVEPGKLPNLEASRNAVMDVDVQKIRQERSVDTTWQVASAHVADQLRRTGVAYTHHAALAFDPIVGHTLRTFEARPFVPSDAGRLTLNSEEAIALMTTGLARRLLATSSKHMILGISGGSDSMLALMIAVRVADTLGWKRDRIHAVTMPGFGTTTKTRGRAQRISEALGVTFLERSIEDVARAEFQTLGYNPANLGTVFENVQARARTALLFNHANHVGGIVLGTGDLSELLLGWCTYSGDQMSSFGVNASIPKTLVLTLLRVLKQGQPESVQAELQGTIEDKASPELLPTNDPTATSTQISEDKVGDYRVIDFVGFYFLKYGFSPAKIRYLAHLAFRGVLPPEEVNRAFRSFYERFGRMHFKITAMPGGNGKIGSVSLDPHVPHRFPDELTCEAMFRTSDLAIPPGLQNLN